MQKEDNKIAGRSMKDETLLNSRQVWFGHTWDKTACTCAENIRHQEESFQELSEFDYLKSDLIMEGT